MKFQSYLKNSLASALILVMVSVPVQGWSAAPAASGIGMGAGAGAVSGAGTSAVQSAVKSGIGAATSGAASGALMGAAAGVAQGVISAALGPQWGQIIGSAAGGLMAYIMTDFFYEMGANVDAAQLALETGVYLAMRNVTDKWDPEPKKSYQAAAKNNEDSASVPTTSLTPDNLQAEDLAFKAGVLKNVGIETLGIETVSDIYGSRDAVVENLTYMNYDGDDLVLDDQLTANQMTQISEMQAKNYQWISTAGVARAELGLETAYQAAVDAGAGMAGEITQDNASGDDNITMATSQLDAVNTSVAAMPSTITSTGMGMRVQAVENLELAQRINLSNALQGNVLSVEAARALKNAPLMIK